MTWRIEGPFQVYWFQYITTARITGAIVSMIILIYIFIISHLLYNGALYLKNGRKKYVDSNFLAFYTNSKSDIN